MLKAISLIVISFILSISVILSQAKALALVPGLVIVLIIFINPYYGLLITVFSLLNLGSYGVISGLGSLFSSTFPKIFGILTLFSWGINTLVLKQKVYFNKTIVFSILYFFYTLTSVLYASDSHVSIVESIRLLTIVSMVFLIVNLVRNKRDFNLFIVVLIVSLMIISIIAIYQNLNPGLYLDESAITQTDQRLEGAYIETSEIDNTVSVRSTGTMVHPNWLALYLTMTMPICIAVFLHIKKKGVCFLSVFSCGLSIIALVLTHTRLGILACILFGGLLIYRRVIKPSPMFFAVAILISLIGFNFLPQNYKDRVFNLSMYSKKNSNSISYRLTIQKIGIDIFKANPILGVGVGNFGLHVINNKDPLYRSDYEFHEVIGAHNMYIEMLAEGGIIGASIFLLLIHSIWKDFSKAIMIYKKTDDYYHNLCKAIQVSFLVFLFCAFFLHAQEFKYWWIIASLGPALYRIAETNVMDKRKENVIIHEPIGKTLIYDK